MKNPISLGNIPGPNYWLNKILDLNYNKDVQPNTKRIYQGIPHYNNTLDVINPKVHDISKLKGERTPILNAPEFIDKITSFLHHIPQQWLYCVYFNKIPKLQDDPAEVSREFDSDGMDGGQSLLIQELLNDISNQRGLCWLAHDLGLPGENIEITNGEFDNNVNRGGLMSSPVLTKRAKFEELKIAFMETNASFGDLVIRPWIKLVGHAGLLARDANDPLNCKCNLFIDFYCKTGPNSNMIKRKSYYFHDVVPIAIEGETKTYGSDGDTKSESRTCKFMYNYYKVTSGLMDLGAKGLESIPSTDRFILANDNINLSTNNLA